MKNVIAISILFFLIVTACNKDDVINDQNSEPETKSQNYFPLKTGNYWVYQWYKYDQDSSLVSMGTQDSLVIVKDTLIDGKTFYIEEGKTFGAYHRIGILRDSSSYMIDNLGNTLFSEYNFTDTLHYRLEIENSDTLYSIAYMMKKLNDEIVCPAGTFDSLLNYDGLFNAMHIEINEGVPNPRHIKNYYAPHVGLVYMENSYVVSGNKIIKKLIKYHLEP